LRASTAGNKFREVARTTENTTITGLTALTDALRELDDSLEELARNR
jgi:hypothetical protein